MKRQPLALALVLLFDHFCLNHIVPDDYHCRHGGEKLFHDPQRAKAQPQSFHGEFPLPRCVFQFAMTVLKWWMTVMRKLPSEYCNNRTVRRTRGWQLYASWHDFLGNYAVRSMVRGPACSSKITSANNASFDFWFQTLSKTSMSNNTPTYHCQEAKAILIDVQLWGVFRVVLQSSCLPSLQMVSMLNNSDFSKYLLVDHKR